MDAEYDDIEIVSVIRGFRLIDSESYEREYKSCDGRPLTSGYYIVWWPPDIKVKRFDERAIFYGPFPIRQAAEELIQRMRTPMKTLGSAEITDTRAGYRSWCLEAPGMPDFEGTLKASNPQQTGRPYPLFRFRIDPGLVRGSSLTSSH